MNNVLQQQENIDNIPGKVIDLLKIKESKEKFNEHNNNYREYINSEDFFNDIKNITKALGIENTSYKIKKETGNVSNNVKKVRLSGIVLCKKHTESCEEMKVLNMKIANSFPKITIIYLSFSAFASGVFIVFLMLSIFKGINVLHPVMSLLFSIGFIGLFFTAFTSIYDWRKMLNGIK